MKEDAQEAKPKMRKAEDTLGHFECISKILSSQAIFDRVQLSLCNISSLPLFFKGTRLSLLTFYTHHLSTELSAVGAKRDVENIPKLSFGLTIHPRPCRTFNNKLTRPSKQCKSLIDVLILSNILRGIFCGGDETWINYRALLFGN